MVSTGGDWRRLSRETSPLSTLSRGHLKEVRAIKRILPTIHHVNFPLLSYYYTRSIARTRSLLLLKEAESVFYNLCVLVLIQFVRNTTEHCLYADKSLLLFQYPGNESLLYFSTYPYTEIQIFAPELGPFESGTFVMEHEYMFVRVSFVSLSRYL